MSIQNDLITEEISLSKIRSGKHTTTCPKCSHRREGQRDLEVTVSPTLSLAEWSCKNCLWSGKVGAIEEAAPQHIDPANAQQFEKPVAPKAKPITGDFKHLARYHIDEKTIEQAQVTYDGEIRAFAFPYFEAGHLVNIAHITLEGQVNYQPRAKSVLYGIDNVKPMKVIDHHSGDTTEMIELILVDSEIIQLALTSLGLNNVLGVPQGAKASKNGYDFLAASAELFEEATKITLVCSSDPSGEAMKKELARRIGAAKCSTIALPDGMKNLAEVLLKLGADVALAIIAEATPLPIKGLYEVSDFEDSLLQYFDVGMAAGVSTGWENVDRFYTVLPGEVTVVTGIPNMGKSEWLDALVMNLAENHGWRFAAFSPEHSKEEHTTKLIEKRVQMPTMPGHSNRMTRETFITASSWVCHYFILIVSDDEEDMPSLDWVLERFRAAVLRYGIKGAIIDPWNEIENARPQGMSETDFVSLCLSKIKRFARTYDVHVWIVAHPRTQYADPKTGEFRIPSLYDISGSAHWVNKPHNGIVIHRKGDAIDSTTVVIRKIKKKFVGKRGETSLVYALDTGRYSTPTDQQKDAIYTKGKKSALPAAAPLEGDSDVVIIEPEA